jgi:type II secretory pathway component PulM
MAESTKHEEFMTLLTRLKELEAQIDSLREEITRLRARPGPTPSPHAPPPPPSAGPAPGTPQAGNSPA